MATRDDIQALHDSFDDLYDALDQAYWAASTAEAKDQIHGAMNLVKGLVDDTIRADFRLDDAQFADLNQSLKIAVHDINDLKAKVDKIVHNVEVATAAIGAIDKALVVAGKVLSL